jgi:flagellar biogenesis protein FliO
MRSRCLTLGLPRIVRIRAGGLVVNKTLTMEFHDVRDAHGLTASEHLGDAEMVTLIEILAATLVVGYTASYLTLRHFFPPARS